MRQKKRKSKVKNKLWGKLKQALKLLIFVIS